MNELPWPQADRITRRMCADAVVVVPGIMGSALRDTDTGDTIWGLQPAWYARAWSPGGPGMTPLAVTEDEMTGRRNRVEATGLLQLPAFLPILRGLEPYTGLVDLIRRLVPDRSAVRAFAYDWRLSVRHNTPLLADAVRDHLERWQAGSGGPDAQVVLVAHSMGGLLCQALAGIPGATDGIRAIVTLGAPFDGAAQAAVILGSGSAGGLPAGRLRRVALTMPGIYDLLPHYRSVHQGNDARRLTVGDVVGLDGNEDLARAAIEDHAARSATVIPNHHALIGVEQPTVSSLTLDNGIATGQTYAFETHPDGELKREPNGRLLTFTGLGDGTVPHNSSAPRHGVPAMPLGQQHTTLAQSDEAHTFVRRVLLHGHVADDGARLGDGDVGLTLPDIVRPGKEFPAVLTGIDPYHATCTVTDADTGREFGSLDAHRRDGSTQVSIILPAPGLYRVRVDGGSTPVTQFVLAVDGDLERGSSRD